MQDEKHNFERPEMTNMMDDLNNDTTICGDNCRDVCVDIAIAINTGKRCYKEPFRTVERMVNKIFHEYEYLNHIPDRIGGPVSLETFTKIVDSMFKDGQINWGKITTAFILMKHVSDPKACGEYMASRFNPWIKSRGGWNEYVKIFREPTNYMTLTAQFLDKLYKFYNRCYTLQFKVLL